MSGWRGIAAGVLGLVALQTIVGTQQGPGRVAGLMGSIAQLAARFVDPTVPAFGQAKPAKATKAAEPIAPASPTPYPPRNLVPSA